MKSGLSLLALLCIVGVATGQALSAEPDAAADLLRLIPADLPFTVVVRDLERLDRNVKAFAKRVEPDSDGPTMLLDLKEDLGIGDLIDFKQPFALATIQDGQADEKMVFWAAVPGFAEKVGAIAGATKDGDIWRIPRGDDATEQVRAKLVGGYALVAKDEAGLCRATAGERNLAETLKLRPDGLPERNVFMHVNMGVLRQDAVAGVAQTAQMAPMMAMALAPQWGADPSLLTAGLTSLFEAVKAFVEQVSYIDIRADLGTDAADITLATGYRDGVIRKYLANQKPASIAPFAQFEEQPYLIAMAYHMPGVESPFLDFLVDQAVKVLQAPPTMGAPGDTDAAPAVDDAAVKRSAEMTRQLLRAIEGTTALLAMKGEQATALGDYIGPNPQRIIDLTGEYLVADNPILNDFKGVSYKALGPVAIGSTSVRQYEMTAEAGSPAAEMFGANTHFALGIRAEWVRYCTGTSTDIQAAFAPKVISPLSASRYVKEALAALPAKWNTIVLLDPAAMVPLLGPAMGKPNIRPLSPGPVIAVSASLSGQPARVDIHVPLRAIERVAQAMSPAKPTE